MIYCNNSLNLFLNLNDFLNLDDNLSINIYRLYNLFKNVNWNLLNNTLLFRIVRLF